MERYKYITDKEIDFLSNEIKNKLFKPLNVYKVTIFLCGASLGDTTKLRSKIAESILTSAFSYRYDIVYPENIFDELLYGSNSLDLLSLEEILAESVDVLIIIPESPGSFAELGAFANNEKLRQKTICILDKKYKKHKSFINKGPIKLIKKTNKNSILYIDTSDLNEELNKVTRRINQIKRSEDKPSEELHLLQLENFLLPVIYLLEPVNKYILTRIVASSIKNKKAAYQFTTTALAMLIKNKRIQINSEGYSLTDKGILDFHRMGNIGTRNKNVFRRDELDSIRLKILNFTNRQKKLKIS